MGLIMDTNDEILGLEERRESFNVLDLKRKYPHELPQSAPLYSLGRSERGLGRYSYAVMKGYGTDAQVFIECGDNEFKAEQITLAMNLLEEKRAPKSRLSEHIFAYQDGEIEVSKEYLKKLLAFFENPENRKKLESR